MTPGDRGDPNFLRGVELFRDGDFYEAHEALEDFWNSQEGDRKSFAQGLIQAAVACHHLQEGNVRGAVSLYRSSRAKLAPHTPQFLGLSVDLLLGQMDALFGPLDPGGPAPEEIRRDLWPRPAWSGEGPL